MKSSLNIRGLSLLVVCTWNIRYITIQFSHIQSTVQFSVPQIEYPLGGSRKNGSHVYFLVQVFWVILLFDINVVLMLPWWFDVTIVQSDITIVVPLQLSTGSKDDYLFGYCPLVCVLFEVLRIAKINSNCCTSVKLHFHLYVYLYVCISVSDLCEECEVK